jgi:hypothetical protein
MVLSVIIHVRMVDAPRRRPESPEPVWQAGGVHAINPHPRFIRKAYRCQIGRPSHLTNAVRYMASSVTQTPASGVAPGCCKQDSYVSKMPSTG